MRDSEKLLNSILVAVANLDKEMRARFDLNDQRWVTADQSFKSMEQNFKVVDQNFALVAEQFQIIDQRFEAIDKRFDSVESTLTSHDLEIRKNGVLLEALNDKIDTVIEGLEGTREALARRIDDHETRISRLENS